MSKRHSIRNKKRIVIKIGTSTITHTDTGHLDLVKMEHLSRILTNLRNQNKEIIVVSSGAVGAGRKALGIKERPTELAVKQACAAVGQARLMMIYEKLFAEYNQTIAQILITKRVLVNETLREDAHNTTEQLLSMGVIPIVNENDVVSPEELKGENYGDNDTLSAALSVMAKADLLILLSDIDGLYTDDPHKNPDAKLLHQVDQIDEKLEAMGKGAGSTYGTGGMATKIEAAKMATESGIDMVIANGEDLYNIVKILDGEDVGTLFIGK